MPRGIALLQAYIPSCFSSCPSHGCSEIVKSRILVRRGAAYSLPRHLFLCVSQPYARLFIETSGRILTAPSHRPAHWLGMSMCRRGQCGVLWFRLWVPTAYAGGALG